MPHLFSFAAKGLQNYVLEGGQLKTMVGATEIIDRLCRTENLKKWLEAAEILDAQVLQGAAGTARIVISNEADAQCLARVWPVFCHAFAPRLEVVQTLVEIKDGNLTEAIEQAEEKMRADRNFPAPELPVAAPVMELARRSGRPASGTVKEHGRNLPADASAVRKAQVRGEILTHSGVDVPRIFQTFGITSMKKDDKQLPQDFEQIAGGKDAERSYLAIIHADGNGLGQIFMDVAETAKSLPQSSSDKGVQKFFAELSKKVVEEGTHAAVEKAVEALDLPAEKMRPILPVVLAGDDVTVVCRADLAWRFTKELLTAFGDEMQARLGALKKDGNHPEELRAKLPSALSMGAGLVFAPAKYPFHLSYALCESLAKHAKDTAKKRGKTPPPASISFHRLTGSMAPEDFEELSQSILRGSEVPEKEEIGDNKHIFLTACPYYLGDGEGPSVEALEAFAKAVKDFPGGTVRGIIELLSTEASAVAPAIQRMLDVADSKQKIKPLQTACEQLGCDPKLFRMADDFLQTPLPDAWALLKTGTFPKEQKH